jgi:transposase-like protein
MRRIIETDGGSKSKERDERVKASTQANTLDSRIELIQMLIPLGLKAVAEELEAEVERLVGARYSRENPDQKRWGTNPGSVFLGEHKVAVQVPRVRDVAANREVPLASYQALQNPRPVDDRVLAHVINGISTRKFERAAEALPECFGVSKSSVSRKFVRATAKKLEDFSRRDLSQEDIVAIFIDGKRLAQTDMILALGVTMEGEKIILGLIEAGTENYIVCRDFINDLLARGLRTEQEILFIIDGAKGLYKGIKAVLREKAIVQRCQWHKREHVVSYLNQTQAEPFRKKLQAAYEKPTYEAAQASLRVIQKELTILNASAAKSLEEGLEETLTLHRLGLFKELGTSFKTTNCIESLNRQVGIYTDRVDYWKNSDQRQRWVAAAGLEIEPHLRKVKGYRHLKTLRQAMSNLNLVPERKKVA